MDSPVAFHPVSTGSNLNSREQRKDKFSYFSDVDGLINRSTLFKAWTVCCISFIVDQTYPVLAIGKLVLQKRSFKVQPHKSSNLDAEVDGEQQLQVHLLPHLANTSCFAFL